jgi:stage II sporulation SpoD-like protein
MAEKQVVPNAIRVLMTNGRVQEMKLETYLAGAVAMAIGTNAPLEALKAQAVASRTYAARAKRHIDLNADVCTTVHCQKWKRMNPIVAPEVFRAVSETWGTVALHEGELIEAFFFEHCPGKTRDAEELAMPAYHYLTSVDCKCGFTDMKGHGVGMCQRGAIVMARQGTSFKEILTHYYRGVEVVQTRTDAPPILSPPPPRVHPSKQQAKKKPGALSPSAKPAPVMNIAKDGLAALIDALNQAAASFNPHHEATQVQPPKQTGEGIEPTKPGIEPSAASPAAPQPAADGPTPPTSVEPAPPSLQAILAAMGAETSASSTDKSASIVQPAAPAEKPAEKAVSDEPHLDEVIHVDMLPGPRVIAGSLKRAGMKVEIEDIRGHKTTVYTGSAPHYGAGGFEAAVEGDGFYTVTVGDKIIEVNVRGETAFLRPESANL